MNTDLIHFEEGLFAGALALPRQARTAFLLRACGGDAPLQARVEALLRGHDEIDGAVDRSPVADLPTLTRALQFEAASVPASADRIGRYQLEEKLGEGGFGIVWRARQQEPVQREVALKLLRPGMDTREFIARFAAERQALALMDHPNIARVFDGGATDDGRPFFVMEFFPGIPITRYCDEHALSLAARLQLFLQVCRAVQHAHQKGIIHRDLKPSNILVAGDEGTPALKVIDFGIAKTLRGQTASATLATGASQVLGTPAYMSPEQFEVGTAIDTRSDIYNLGVLLYELITGQTPFDGQLPTAAGFVVWRDVICTRDPARPSHRIGLLDEGTRERIAQCRGLDGARLRARLRGDLDLIVMRCLEKDPVRRYDTANALALDLERQASHQPVSVRPPTTAYVLAKTIRRHRVAFASATAMAASLVFALVASAAETRRATAAERAASVDRSRAYHVAQLMKDMLKGVGPQVALGRDTSLLRAIVDDTRLRVQRELTGEPAVRADLLEALGLVYSAIGDDVTGEALLRETLALQVQLTGRDHPAVARLLHELAQVLRSRNRTYELEAPLEEALALRRKHLGPRHADTAETLSDLGRAIGLTQREKGERLLREALEIQRERLGPAHPAIARTLMSLGEILDLQPTPQKAEPWLREALEVARRTAGAESIEVIQIESRLGRNLWQQQRFADAEVVMHEALARCERVLGKSHSLRLDPVLFLGQILRSQGRFAEAAVALREGLALAQQHQNSRAGQILSSLVRALMSAGLLADAEQAARDAIVVARATAPNDQLRLGLHLAALTEVLLATKRFADAELPAREAFAVRQRADTKGWLAQNSRRMLGEILERQEKFAEAEGHLVGAHDALVALRAKFPDDAEAYRALALPSLIRLYRRWDRPADMQRWIAGAEALAVELTAKGNIRLAGDLRKQAADAANAR